MFYMKQAMDYSFTHPVLDTLPKEEPAFSRVLASLSYALDSAAGRTAGHALRTCILGMKIGFRLGLNDQELSDLYYALLLKDSGSSSGAACSFELLGHDEIEASRLLGSGWQHLSWLKINQALRIFYPQHSVKRRTQSILRSTLKTSDYHQQIAQMRCGLSIEVARYLELSPGTTKAIYHIDENWNGQGYPDNLPGPLIPMLSQIVRLAQTVEAFREIYGGRDALHLLRKRCPGWFDPGLVAMAAIMFRTDESWNALSASNLLDAVVELEPDMPRKSCSPAMIDRICRAFALIIDSRSRYTTTHSTGVADIAIAIGHRLGLEEDQLTDLRRAALLHDIGKLGIPIAVLEWPGPLNNRAWRIIKQHTRLTYEILSRIPGFHQIAEVASSHHERLDGSGYHLGVRANSICILSRILAVADTAEAMAARRSYRPSLSLQEINDTLNSLAPHALDLSCVRALQTINFMTYVA